MGLETDHIPADVPSEGMAVDGGMQEVPDTTEYFIRARHTTTTRTDGTHPSARSSK